MKRGKRYSALKSKLEPSKVYSLNEALAFIIQSHPEKFDAGVEVHLKLGIDTKKSEQQVRSTITLPHGTGKTKKVAAFVTSGKEAEAKEAGADLVGGEDLIAEIKKTEKTDFELAVAMPEMMPKLSSIAKILGTRGLMPSPKNETVTTNIKKTIEELKKGKVAFKSDNTGNIHQLIGKVSFGEAKLGENFTVLLEAIKKVRPAGTKGIFLKSVTLCTSMGPGVRVAV
ncbi:MAG: 50S ribosomal protein L1 [Patescibacteria group bacterium]|jgi:large subunit ribosomal protein L1